MSATLFTIGYEGTQIDAFVATLIAAGIETVADVRAVPISRKRGFSKRALSEALAASGIAYKHFARLGNPRAGRDAARSGHLDAFRAIFAEHLTTCAARADLSTLEEVARQSRTCLLCFEHDPGVCHRTLVANQLLLCGIATIDLFVPPAVHDVRHSADRARRHPGQGGSAAESPAW